MLAAAFGVAGGGTLGLVRITRTFVLGLVAGITFVVVARRRLPSHGDDESDEVELNASGTESSSGAAHRRFAVARSAPG